MWKTVKKELFLDVGLKKFKNNSLKQKLKLYQTHVLYGPNFI